MIRHFYYFTDLHPNPTLPRWNALQKAVESKYRFDGAKINFKVIKEPPCVDVVLTTISDNPDRLALICDFICGWLEAFGTL